jgi:YVTN family beta-propeller protein
MSGDLSVIDPAERREIRRIRLGKRPRGLAASPDGRLLYIALSGSAIAGPGVDESTLPLPDRTADGIAVLDIASGRVLRVLRGISDPEQVAVSPDGRRLFVASEDSGLLFVLDARTGVAVARLEVGGEPEGVAASPDGRIVYATSEEDGTVAAVETAPPRVRARIAVGGRPRNAAFSADGRRAFVPGESDASITAIDVAADRVVGRVRLAGQNTRPMGVALTSDQRHLLVTTGRGGQLVRLDPATLRETGRVAVGDRPWGLAIGPANRFAFTANGPSNDVAMVDLATLRVVARISAGNRPWGVAAVEVR